MLHITDEGNSATTYKIAETIIHPNYNSLEKNNDIALLKLDQSITFNENIYPVCLPVEQKESPAAIASGFGRTDNEFDKFHSDDLLKVSLQKFTHEECQDKHDGENTINKDTMLCYGHRTQGKDSCEVNCLLKERKALSYTFLIFFSIIMQKNAS